MAEILIARSPHENKDIQCEWEKDIGCFEDAVWYVEGGHYCQFHAQRVIQIMNAHGADIDINKIEWR